MHKLVVMSVDAMFTEDLAEVRHLPAFTEFMANAAIFEDVEAVYPTLTYPCHTTMLTGCWPDWCTGVRTEPFRAHAWVEVDGRPVGEGEDARYYRAVMTVPARR